jgi:hypothetical protein
MANEIQIVAQMKCQKESFNFPLVGQTRKQITQEGLGGGVPGMVTVGPVAQQVVLTGLDSPGWVRMENIDKNQSLRWSFTEAGIADGGIMLPGEPALFRLAPGAELWLQVDPGTEESESTSDENQAKAQIFVLEA